MECRIEADLVSVTERRMKNGDVFKIIKLGKDYNSVDVVSFDGVVIPNPEKQQVVAICELVQRGYNYSLSLIDIVEM